MVNAQQCISVQLLSSCLYSFSCNSQVADKIISLAPLESCSPHFQTGGTAIEYESDASESRELLLGSGSRDLRTRHEEGKRVEGRGGGCSINVTQMFSNR